MKSEDLYVRLTDPTGKRREVINHHRVWDRASSSRPSASSTTSRTSPTSTAS
ncbi:hypothetical protein [Pseudomonas aeruginosa]|uniref:hypothetical protein n=1 Tax=Pseudomonas aeruginosa TaxID=287 RepID=UPI00300CC7AC